MKLVSWNVNGIRAVHRKGLFVSAVETLKPDILCLQETKAEEHQSEVDLPEYEEYWNSSKGKKGYSGTAIFSKEKPLSVMYDFPEEITKKYNLLDKYGNLAQEGRVITADYSPQPASGLPNGFFVVNCYTPNSKPDLSRLPMRHKHWDPAFLEFCVSLKKKKPVIFCGDLNVAHTEEDLENAKANEGDHGFTKEERGGIDNIIAKGFVDSFRKFQPTGKGFYTWWSNFGNARARNVGWRIDYFFVDEKISDKIVSAKIFPEIMGSDHCPVSVEISL